MGAKLAIVMFMLLLGVGGIGYWYYNDTQERLAILTSNNAKLNTAVELNEQTISSLENDYEKASSELASLNEAYIAIRRQNQRLADKLQEIDLTAAAIANAEGIERAVNRGTENAGRCFELLSGAELNDKERNAENGIAFNKECPWLYDTYKSRGLLNQTTAD
jgi:septal ring factor EnvC (AmiA/AmiB activator)